MSKSTNNRKKIIDTLLKKYGYTRPVENKAFESVIKAESKGCSVYSKAVLENKPTYNWVDADDEFDVAFSWIEATKNWAEVLGDEKMAEFACELGKKFKGDGVCVTFQNGEVSAIHCIALFIDNNGAGVLKYNKLVDKATADFEQNVEMKL